LAVSNTRTPKSVKASCDKLFSKLIRSKNQCERCGNPIYEQLHCAHIYSRKFGSVRFDENNAKCLCAKCHRWAHDNPTEFTKWLSRTVDLDKLMLKKNKVVKRKLADWLTLEEELKRNLLHKKYLV